MWSSRSRRQLSTQRSATPFCQGLSKEVRTGLIFMDRTAPGTSNPYFASRSKIRDRGADWNGNASRSSCTIHRLVGWFVTLKCRMRRRSWLMTKKQQSTPNVIVGTVKKSIAAIASRWFRRKASQRLAGSGSLGARFIQREIVLSERSKPSMRSSPWIRGAPQVGFSATIWKINSRTCFGVRLLPTCVRTLEISLQYIRKPVRCQRTTVSGVTTMRACFHPDQNRRTTTQKSLSSRPMLGRRCRRFSTASCCRSTRFSNSRFPRLRNGESVSDPEENEAEHGTEVYQINDWEYC